jgi:hypothetical protein
VAKQIKSNALVVVVILVKTSGYKGLKSASKLLTNTAKGEGGDNRCQCDAAHE